MCVFDTTGYIPIQHLYLNSPAHHCCPAKQSEDLQDTGMKFHLEDTLASSPFCSVPHVPHKANAGTVCLINGQNQSTTSAVIYD